MNVIDKLIFIVNTIFILKSIGFYFHYEIILFLVFGDLLMPRLELSDSDLVY